MALMCVNGSGECTGCMMCQEDGGPAVLSPEAYTGHWSFLAYIREAGGTKDMEDTEWD
ncbi:MAG: hypothetical protein KHW59_07105 [Clostridiales bacterium]|nr:hypothetical protein [Clostridiales bacterium]